MAEYQKLVQTGTGKGGTPIMQMQTFRFKSKDSQSRKRMKGKAAGGRQSRYAAGRSSLSINLGIMDPMLEKAMMGRNQ
tara:strand:- start:201 stop:434 length:234 start_codon:yes stop_codon:yes gene_type:complete